MLAHGLQDSLAALLKLSGRDQLPGAQTYVNDVVCA